MLPGPCQAPLKPLLLLFLLPLVLVVISTCADKPKQALLLPLLGLPLEADASYKAPAVSGLEACCRPLAVVLRANPCRHVSSAVLLAYTVSAWVGKVLKQVLLTAAAAAALSYTVRAAALLYARLPKPQLAAPGSL